MAGMPESMRERYEIHFVASGSKEVIIIERSSMCDLEAWKAALLHQGECAGSTFNIRLIADAMEIAAGCDIRKVRWNKASHTIAWSERGKLVRHVVGLIVPTLCVGMPPGTLRVPLTTHDMSLAQR